MERNSMIGSSGDRQIPSPEADFVDNYLLHLANAIDAISRQEVWAVVDVLFEAWKDGRRIFIFGNGGSASTASHMATDLNKQAIVEGGCPRLKALALTDNIGLMTAWGNDTHFDNIFAEQLANHLEQSDVTIGISTSGNSGNVLRALEVARQMGAITIGFTGHDGGKMKALVDYCIYIPDDNIGRQEDGHLILNHVIANALRQKIARSFNNGVG